MHSRAQLLEALLDHAIPLEQALTGLHQFAWDHDEVLAILTRRHVASTLERYLSGELTDSAVEAWANAIEGREDIDYEAGHEGLLQEAIHQLANPLLTEPLNKQSAERVLQKL